MRTVEIIDQTLREGCQSPGIYLNPNQKIVIIDALIELGISNIEIGIAGTSYKEDVFLNNLLFKYKNNKFFVSSFLSKKCYSSIKSLNPPNWFLIVPTSPFLIEAKFGFNYLNYIHFIKEQIEALNEESIMNKPFIVLEDASRTENAELIAIMSCFVEAGYSKFLYSDTVGQDTPETFSEKYTLLKEIYPESIFAVHFHNDTGMALANSVTARMLGVNLLTATINGIGERVGICDLMQLTYYLNYNCDFMKLSVLCNHLSNTTNSYISPNTPIIGENIFLCETGTHIAAMIKNKDSYNAFKKNILAKETKFLLGKNSGKSSLKYYLDKNNIELDISDMLFDSFKDYFIDKSCKNEYESNINFLEFISKFNYNVK